MDTLDLMGMFYPNGAAGKVVTAFILLLFGVSTAVVVRNLWRVAREAKCLDKARAILDRATQDHSSTESVVEELLDNVPASVARRRIDLLYRVRQLHSLSTDLLHRAEQYERTSDYRFPRFAMSMMVVLGLLGTVIGLSVSVQGILPTVTNISEIDVNRLLEALSLALGGLQTAFSTTLTGLGCTFLLAGLLLVNQRAEGRFRVRMEAFLTMDLMPRVLISSEMEARTLYVEAIETSAQNIGRAADTLDRSREGIRAIVDGLVEATQTVESRTTDFFNFAQSFHDSVSGLEGFVVGHAEKLESVYRKIDDVLREIQQNQITDKIIGEIVDRSVARAIDEANQSAADVREAFRADLKEIMAEHGRYLAAIEKVEGAISGLSEASAARFEEVAKRAFDGVLERFDHALDKAIVQQDIGRMIGGELMEQFRAYLEKAADAQRDSTVSLRAAVTALAQQSGDGTSRRESRLTGAPDRREEERA